MRLCRRWWGGCWIGCGMSKQTEAGAERMRACMEELDCRFEGSRFCGGCGAETAGLITGGQVFCWDCGQAKQPTLFD